MTKRNNEEDALKALTPPASIWSPVYRSATVGLFSLAFLVAYSVSAITTAMPRAAQELHGLSLYGLAFAVTMATSVVAMAFAAPWIDRAGPGAALMAGIAVDCAGLLVSAAAPTMEVLVAGRAVQGIGAGLEGVALYVVIARVFPAAIRPKMFAALSAAWVLPSIIGPAISGAITDQFGWRWVFVTVPIVAVGAVALVRAGTRGASLHGAGTEAFSGGSDDDGHVTPRIATVVDEPVGEGPLRNSAAHSATDSATDADDDGRALPQAAKVAGGLAAEVYPAPATATARTNRAARSSGRKESVWYRPGLALAAACAVLLIGDASQRSHPWWPAELTIAVVVLVLSAPKLLPRGTWLARRGLPSVVLMRALVGTAFTLGDVYLPLLMIQQRGMPAWLAGLSLTVGGVTWFTGSALAGRGVLTARLRLQLGAAALLVGVLISALVVLPTVPVWVAWLGWCFSGLGIGISYPTLSVMLLELSPVAEQGRNSSALQLNETLTTSALLGVVGAVFAALLGTGGLGFAVAFALAAVLSLAALFVAGRAA